MTIADVLQALVFSLLAAGGGFLLTRLADAAGEAWRRKGARNK